MAVIGRDHDRRCALAAALAPLLPLPVLCDEPRPDLAISATPFADHATRMAATGRRLICWDDLPELGAAVATRLAPAAANQTKAVIVLPSFPAADARDELEQLDDVDRFARAAVIDAGLDRWASAAVAWEPIPADAGEGYGVRAAEVVRGLADLGRTRSIVVVPVGIDTDHPGITAAAELARAARMGIEIAERADLDDAVVAGLAGRVAGALA